MRLSISILFATVVAVVVGATAGASSAAKVLELRYPKATSVPKGSRYLKAPATTPWTGDITSLTASGHAMYVGTSTGMQQIDAGSNGFGSPLLGGIEAADLAYADGLIWASDYDANVVRAVDESTGKVSMTVQLPDGSSPEGIVAAAGAVWVAEHHTGSVARIDPSTGRVVAQIEAGFLGASGPQGLTYGAGSLWVSVPNSADVVRIDPATNSVIAKIRVPGMEPCGGIAVGTSAVWVTSCLDDMLVARISIATNEVVRVIDMHARSIEPVAQGDTAWFLVGRDPDNQSAKYQHAYLVQLSSSDRVLHRYDLGSRFTPGGTAIAFGSLWASSFTTPWVARIPLG
jgi:streptogramin lyase